MINLSLWVNSISSKDSCLVLHLIWYHIKSLPTRSSISSVSHLNPSLWLTCGFDPTHMRQGSSAGVLISRLSYSCIKDDVQYPLTGPTLLLSHINLSEQARINIFPEMPAHNMKKWRGKGKPDILLLILLLGQGLIHNGYCWHMCTEPESEAHWTDRQDFISNNTTLPKRYGYYNPQRSSWKLGFISYIAYSHSICL